MKIEIEAKVIGGSRDTKQHVDAFVRDVLAMMLARIQRELDDHDIRVNITSNANKLPDFQGNLKS